jgi:hypothetical protein
MKPDFECAIAASFLSSGRVLANIANCAALIAAAGSLLAHTLSARLLFATSLLCWPVACYFGLRVSIDARLFRELARAPDEGGQSLDDLLRAWGLGNAKSGRSLADRSRGALRLWKRLIAAVAVQLLVLSAGVLIQGWRS